MAVNYTGGAKAFHLAHRDSKSNTFSFSLTNNHKIIKSARRAKNKAKKRKLAGLSLAATKALKNIINDDDQDNEAEKGKEEVNHKIEQLHQRAENRNRYSDYASSSSDWLGVEHLYANSATRLSPQRWANHPKSLVKNPSFSRPSRASPQPAPMSLKSCLKPQSAPQLDEDQAAEEPVISAEFKKTESKKRSRSTSKELSRSPAQDDDDDDVDPARVKFRRLFRRSGFRPPPQEQHFASGRERSQPGWLGRITNKEISSRGRMGEGGLEGGETQASSESGGVGDQNAKLNLKEMREMLRMSKWERKEKEKDRILEVEIKQAEKADEAENYDRPKQDKPEEPLEKAVSPRSWFGPSGPYNSRDTDCDSNLDDSDPFFSPVLPPPVLHGVSTPSSMDLDPVQDFDTSKHDEPSPELPFASDETELGSGQESLSVPLGSTDVQASDLDIRNEELSSRDFRSDDLDSNDFKAHTEQQPSAPPLGPGSLPVASISTSDAQPQPPPDSAATPPPPLPSNLSPSSYKKDQQLNPASATAAEDSSAQSENLVLPPWQHCSLSTSAPPFIITSMEKDILEEKEKGERGAECERSGQTDANGHEASDSEQAWDKPGLGWQGEIGDKERKAIKWILGWEGGETASNGSKVDQQAVEQAPPKVSAETSKEQEAIINVDKQVNENEANSTITSSTPLDKASPPRPPPSSSPPRSPSLHRPPTIFLPIDQNFLDATLIPQLEEPSLSQMTAITSSSLTPLQTSSCKSPSPSSSQKSAHQSSTRSISRQHSHLTFPQHPEPRSSSPSKYHRSTAPTSLSTSSPSKDILKDFQYQQPTKLSLVDYCSSSPMTSPNDLNPLENRPGEQMMEEDDDDIVVSDPADMSVEDLQTELDRAENGEGKSAESEEGVELGIENGSELTRLEQVEGTEDRSSEAGEMDVQEEAQVEVRDEAEGEVAKKGDDTQTKRDDHGFVGGIWKDTEGLEGWMT